MKVALITAKQHNLGYPYRLNAPLSCATISGCLNRAGMEAEAVDLDGMGVDENWFIDGIPEYDAIGISALSAQAEGARRLISLIRHHAPSKYIVCGGVDPTLEPRKYLTWGADCVVTGECEGNVASIFEHQMRGIIPGEVGNIDPMPDWDHHIPKPWQYPGHPHPLALPEAIVMVTRGCPHKCTFCANPYNGHRTRTRDLAVVGEEFDYLAANGVKSIFLYDDEIVDKNLLPYLHRVLSLSQGRFPFRAQGRCNLDQECLPILKELCDMGLKRVMWGIESFCQPVLDAIRKDTTVESIRATLLVSGEAGIENFAFLMAGLPEETPHLADLSAREFEFLLMHGIVEKAQATVCTPMLGTPLYEQAKAGGWLPQSDPYQYDIGGGTPWMSQGDLADHVNAMRRLAAKYGAL